MERSDLPVAPTQPEASECGSEDATTHVEEEDKDTGQTAPAGTELDEDFAYMQRGFTTEIYKIEIRNIPVHVGFKQLRKRLKSLNLSPVKIKIIPHQKACFVTFRNEEDRQAALTAVNGHVWKKASLTAKNAAPSMDPIAKRKRRVSSSDGEEDVKQPCLDPLLSVEERLASVVTPLWMKPYPDQLKDKMDSLTIFMRKVVAMVKKSGAGEWFSTHTGQHSGLFCSLEPIRASPVLEEYRNKCEFNVGLDLSGKLTVGFRIGTYEKGDLSVASPESCIHVPRRMKQIAAAFECYMRETGLEPYSHYTGQGYWRQLTVRSFTTGDNMAMLQIHPQQLSSDEIEVLKKKLVEFFTVGEGAPVVPSSVYFQCFDRRTSTGEKAVFCHLVGEKYIHEQLLGLKFRISPDSFFQVNTQATEVLYSLVGEMCSSAGRPVVYDICCGTGTIGLCLAKRSDVLRVVGVEMVESAVEDARENARINDVSNAEFICGKAEDVLPDKMTKEDSPAEVVGIADPPRAGLHPKVVKAIRNCRKINKLVYISCNPQGALQNFVDLCRPMSNRMKGLPFRPVKAVPVDLFPHSPHCELVLEFARIEPDLLAYPPALVDPVSPTKPGLPSGQDVVEH